MRIAILTCHLAGSGHFVRSLALARAALARGHLVRLVSGGRPLAHVDATGVDLVQLPPLTVEGFDFGVLRAPGGSPATERYMAARREALVAALAPFRADVLVTETWPFGRRALAAEFEAAAALAGALVASVRDIPEPKPKRLAEVAERLRRGFRGVVVHGDAAFLPLAESWPLPGDVAALVRHTGYLGRPGPAEDPPRGDEVVVAVGGGALGAGLVRLVPGAARRSGRPWRLLHAGPVADPPPNLTVEPPRADYPALIARAAASVSLCGYNTALDLAQCATPALLVPAAMGGDREQAIRAERLSRFNGFACIAEDVLTMEALAETAERLAAGPRRARPGLRIDVGGAAALAAIEGWG